MGRVEGGDEVAQRPILFVGERREIGALEFNADGKVVAVGTALELRETRVPGTIVSRHELNHVALPRDEEVRGDTRTNQTGIEGMGREVERPRKKARDVAAAENAWRQTDVVD